MVSSTANMVESTHKSRKSKVTAVQEEDKFKWDADDFYAKLPPNKHLLAGVQTMVKIEPVTDQLLAYKKPSSPKKKWFEDEQNSSEYIEQARNKHAGIEKRHEEKSINKENQVVGIKSKHESMFLRELHLIIAKVSRRLIKK